MPSVEALFLAAFAICSRGMGRCRRRFSRCTHMQSDFLCLAAANVGQSRLRAGENAFRMQADAATLG